MGKTVAQKARRSRQKKRKKLLQRLYPDPTLLPDSREEDEEGSLRSPQKRRRRESSSSSESDAAGEAEAPDGVRALLESNTKDQLVGYLCDAALADPALHARIRDAAERDVSHRNVFVHGLSWDVTKEMLLGVFSTFGAVESCKLVASPGKYYAFVLFHSRSGAFKALKERHKQIGKRIAHCELASLGRSGTLGGAAEHRVGTTGRKIYVTNVHAEANREKLKEFFAQFGEIAVGPRGFDLVTGKSKGYAVFVYKTEEAAQKALEEPCKMFEGHQLHCEWAKVPAKEKELVSTAAVAQPPAVGQAGDAPQSVPASVAAVQSRPSGSQNPLYAAHSAGQNTLLAAAAGMNPAPLATPALNPLAVSPAVDGKLAGYGGSSSLPGAYATRRMAGLRETQYGQPSLGTQGGSSCSHNPAYEAHSGQHPLLAAAAAGINPAALTVPSLNPSELIPAVNGGLTGYGGISLFLGGCGTREMTRLRETQHGHSSLGTDRGPLYSQNPAYAAQFTATLNPSALSPAVNGGLAGYGGRSSLLRANETRGMTGLQEPQYGQSLLGSLGGSLYSQNPAYAAHLDQNPLSAAITGNNLAALAMPTTNPSVRSPAVDGGLADYRGSSSLLGTSGTRGTTELQDMQHGQSLLGKLGGSYNGMSSYLW